MRNLATQIVSTYYGALLITVVGAAATLLIMHVADTGSFAGFDAAAQIAGSE